ncbi:protein BLISTER-like [Cornus florida]|uniref:protein BLISTER-like n=1 Tax=Cornus florida TaxID=4283 RepID=UPI0028A2C1B4|nr:protein BLISTER-like [Cornus florida]
MASAQVLPNSMGSQKQELLEAGKRRLEEFRKKKKAAERAKKAASTSQLHTADADLHEKQPLETENVRLTDSEGAGTSDQSGGAVVGLSGVAMNNDDKAIDLVQNNEIGSLYGKHANPPLSANYRNSFLAQSVQKHGNDQDSNRYNGSKPAEPVNVNYSPQIKEKSDDFGNYSRASGGLSVSTDQYISLHPQAVRDIDSNSSQSSRYALEEAQSKDNDSHLKNFSVTNPSISHVLAANISPENSDSNLLQNKSAYTSPLPSPWMSSSYEESSHEVGQNMQGADREPLWPSQSRSPGFSFDVRSSSNYVPVYPDVAETNTRRSRPSFLDSINMPRLFSASFQPTEQENAESFSSKFHDMDISLASSVSEKSLTETERMEPFPTLNHSMKTSFSASNGDDMYRYSANENRTERKQDFFSQKQDEDFAALEQHIEDLTQEKFSLQRALEASRALAESLASENSALTDSYNQQGSAVNQLKSDMEKLQEEIKAQLVELESVKIEYANAHLECNAADERAQLLASEVIDLEEKALRLRSSELKLERQMENSQAEISSFKKKVSRLEKERQDLQSTIDSLQEEKKLLQAKFRKASANGKFIDISKNLPNKKDMSTSTEDLVHGEDANPTPDTSSLEMHNTEPVFGSNASSSHLLPENRQFNLEASSLNIPTDQMRMIQNINALMSELALEKEELMQSLTAESSRGSKLKELNKELSQKLEVQTQRLELLTSQSMATEIVPARQLDARNMDDNTAYADEGDEVVERVLGWIMKLFPGGPSRRRTSKLL